jgi:hypothetical protein
MVFDVLVPRLCCAKGTLKGTEEFAARCSRYIHAWAAWLDAAASNFCIDSILYAKPVHKGTDGHLHPEVLCCWMTPS